MYVYMLQLLYDLDVLEEGTLLEWADKVKGRYVSKELAADMRKVAEPLLRWLREAEEEEEADSGNEDQEDDLEVGHSNTYLETIL